MIDTTTMTDDRMQAILATVRPCTTFVLHRGPRWGADGFESVIWEHGRRNLVLREQGALVVTLPVPESDSVAGVGVFDRDAATVREILAEDPAIRAGVMTFEVHEAIGFPGDTLPGVPSPR